MKLLICTRYILKQLICSTLSITFSLSVTIWLIQSLHFIDLILNKGFPLTTFLYLMFFLVPDLIGTILPISFFFSCIFICHKLLSNNEIIVMQSSGFSEKQILQAPLILACFISILLYFLNLYLIPISFCKLKDTKYQIHQKSLILPAHGKQFFYIKGFTLNTKKILSNKFLKIIFINDQRFKKTILNLYSQNGTFKINYNYIKLKLFKGTYQRLHTKTKTTKSINFDQYYLKLPFSTLNNVRKHKKNYEKSITKLFKKNKELV